MRLLMNQWVLFLTHAQLVSFGVQAWRKLKVLDEAFFCGSLETVRTSWCPAGPNFSLAQIIYYLTISHLQLSPALLSHSGCRLTVNGKSNLVQTALQHGEA